MMREGAIESVCHCVCMCDGGLYHLCSPVLFFFSLLTLTQGLQIGQLHYQSTGPQIFKTNWIAHPIPITITAGTITKLAIQHNNWKCGLPGPAGLPGGPADLWRHVKPANSTANYWCTAEWSCLSPKYNFQFIARNTGPCWERQKQQRSAAQECGHASLFCSRSFVVYLLCVQVSLYFPKMNIRVCSCKKGWWRQIVIQVRLNSVPVFKRWLSMTEGKVKVGCSVSAYRL